MSVEEFARCFMAGLIGALSGLLVVVGGFLLAESPGFIRIWDAIAAPVERFYGWLSRFLRGGRR
ncbi:MAG: hypothetical protein J7474_04575 [Arthrobacter sp.]|nr:hypothetical protein [Arthrobacter sp.]